MLKDEQKLGVGVSIGIIYYVILYPHLLNFGSYNNAIFRIFSCFICFYGNKLNQENIAKRSKRGTKREEIGKARWGPGWHDGRWTVALGSTC